MINVPQYDCLKLDLILDFGLGYADVVDSLPVLREIRKMPRAYICNVIYTRVGKAFKKWVMDGCQQRNQRLAKEHNTMINLDPRIAAAFKASNFVSQSHGTGSHL